MNSSTQGDSEMQTTRLPTVDAKLHRQGLQILARMIAHIYVREGQANSEAAPGPNHRASKSQGNSRTR